MVIEDYGIVSGYRGLWDGLLWSCLTYISYVFITPEIIDHNDSFSK